MQFQPQSFLSNINVEQQKLIVNIIINLYFKVREFRRSPVTK